MMQAADIVYGGGNGRRHSGSRGVVDQRRLVLISAAGRGWEGGELNACERRSGTPRGFTRLYKG